MSIDGNPRLIDLYTRELAYLREKGADFATAYPKVAARLGISERHCSDPHVERLIESFAFLTARIQSQIDQDSATLTTSLLGILYPQYTSPLPSMAVACFNVDLKDGALTSGFTIDKGSSVYADVSAASSSAGQTCRFQTGFPVTLWPIVLTDTAYVPWEDLEPLHHELSVAEDRAAIRPVGAIRLRLRSTHSLKALAVPSLRFYINGDDVEASRIYDLLFERERPAVVKCVDQSLALAKGRVTPVGFAPDEDLLPYPKHSQFAYRLIQEYFAFPRKFLFFDVELKELPNAHECEILLWINRRPRGLTFRPDTFRLGCTPIVNIFQQYTEPLRVDQRRFEYRLVADARRERFTQIHSLVNVCATGPGEPEQRQYAPYFSFLHPDPGRGQAQVYWATRRVPTERKDLPGSDLYLSFVDVEFNPRRPWSEVIFAKALCTNRQLAESMDADTQLSLEQPAPVVKVVCVTKPTPQIEPPTGGQALWRLVSNLSLNHLSLHGEMGPEALREILRAYLFRPTTVAERQISALAGVGSRTVSQRVGASARAGLCRGTEVIVTLDPTQFGDSSPILFAEVLSRFFALYAQLNSFIVLVLKSTAQEDPKEEWKRWPPMSGAKPLL